MYRTQHYAHNHVDGMKLFALETEVFGDLGVTLGIFLAEVFEEATALGDHFEEAGARVVVFVVAIEVAC